MTEEEPTLDAYGFRVETEDEVKLYRTSQPAFERQVTPSLPPACVPCHTQCASLLLCRCAHGSSRSGRSF